MSSLPPLPTYPRSAYGSIVPRADVQRTRPDKRGWGPGWPDCQGDKMVTVSVTRSRDGRRFNRPIRREVADLFRYLMQTTLDIGAELGSYEFRQADEPGGYVGTFVCRAIKNSDPPAPSWHSWGLAVDINAKSNPMSKTWMATNPPWMVELWESAGWFWGGRYSGDSWYFDPMHFEYLYRPADVAADLANAKAAVERIRAALKLEDEILQSFLIPTVPTVVTVPTGIRLYADSEFSKAVWAIDPGRDMDYLGEPLPGASLVGYVAPDGQRGFLEAGGTRVNKAYFAKTAELTNIRPAPAPPDSSVLQAQLEDAMTIAIGRKQAIDDIRTRAEAAP